MTKGTLVRIKCDASSMHPSTKLIFLPRIDYIDEIRGAFKYSNNQDSIHFYYLNNWFVGIFSSKENVLIRNREVPIVYTSLEEI